MSGNMLNLDGWIETTCATADAIRFCEIVAPYSSLTDPDGNYGTPVIYTEWGIRYAELPVLRDYRWGDSPCRHYVPARVMPTVPHPTPEEPQR